MARTAIRRIPPPRTLPIDAPADLQAFRKVLARRWRLPHVRITLRIGGLPHVRAEAYERSLNRLLGGNPLAAASIAALAMVTLVAVWPMPPAGTQSLLSLGAWAAEGFLGAVVGWLAGTAVYRLVTGWRLARLCAHIEAELPA